MKLLVLDSVPAAAAIIARDLNKAFNLQVLYASSADEATKQLRAEKDAIGILIFFLDAPPQNGLSFIRDVRSLCEFSAIRCPNFVVLTPGDLDGAHLRRFKVAGAECRVYGYPEELNATLRRMLHEGSSEKRKATIIVERGAYHTRFHLLGPSGRELLAYGPRLLPIMNHFAINFGVELSTVELAESAEIVVGTVKVYLMRLRAGYEKARVRAGGSIPAKEVFCTLRKDGGFVHVLRARVIFI